MPGPKRIAILVYDGVQTLDVAGPLDAFAAANDHRPGSYTVQVAGPTPAEITSETGLRMVPDCALTLATDLDTLLVPGGVGLRAPGAAAPISAAILAASQGARRIVSVCTGIYGVAPTGLLNGRRATTHWRYAADVAARFPAIEIVPDHIFVRDGALYSAAGITAAIDLTLALIEEDYGAGLSLSVARDLVVYVKRAGGQLQYSEPLRFQARAAGPFADLAAWIADHLHQKLAVECLADRVGLSPRQFTRRFREAFGATPAEFVETLRLDAARARLTDTQAGLDQIAAATGFTNADSFRRAFVKRFGVAPTSYRTHFPGVDNA